MVLLSQTLHLGYEGRIGHEDPEGTLGKHVSGVPQRGCHDESFTFFYCAGSSRRGSRFRCSSLCFRRASTTRS